MRKLLGLAALALIAGPLPAANAAEFTTSKTDDGSQTIIQLTGVISDGDTQRLTIALGKAAIAGDKIAGVWLNSPGGLIIEGVKLAQLIHDVGMITVVPHDAECDSACFLPFAAGSSKFASRSARVGVHSAINTLAAREDVNAMAATVIMARVAAQYGVPTQVTGTMINTPPTGMAWLSEGDLESMGVVMSGGSQPPTSPGISPIPPHPLPMPIPLQIVGAPEPINDYSTLLYTIVKERCRMNTCSWFSIENAQTAFDSKNERVVEVDLKLWLTDYPDGDYTKKQPRRLDKTSHSFVMCSRSRPRVVDDGGDGTWLQTDLAPGDVNSVDGFHEGYTAIYWAACHGQKVEDVYDAALRAQRLRYPLSATHELAQTTIGELPKEWHRNILAGAVMTGQPATPVAAAGPAHMRIKPAHDD